MRKTLRLRLRSLFRRTLVEDELGAELRYHVERLTDEHVARGLSPAQARAAASREMGAVEQRKEECRDARGLALADSILQDLRHALRAMRKAPGFSAVAILSLTLGIGANTAIFALWNGVLHAPLPGVRDPVRLVMLSNPEDSGSWTGSWDSADGPRAWLAYEEFEELREHADLFSALMASQSTLDEWQVRFDDGGWENARGRLVSGGFFDVLGVSAAAGRLFTAADDRETLPHAVISHSYWRRRFGGRSDVLGRTFGLRKAVFTVIGVTPPGFVGETSGQQPDVWLPLRMQPLVLPGRDRLHDTPPIKSMWLHVFGRLKDGVTGSQAEAQANAIFRAGLETFYGGVTSAERRRDLLDQRLRLQPAARGAAATAGQFSQSLNALLAAVGVLLLIACANLANLLLARGHARRPELALRLSLGASRARVLRQLGTESLTLAAIGGVAALGVAYGMHGALVRMMAESDSDFHVAFPLDPMVLGVAVCATLVSALLFGLMPAWHVTRQDASASLGEASRGASSGRSRSGRLLVGLQLALSLPLLVGAGLLTRTVYNLQRADLGFPIERLLLLRPDLRETAPDAAGRDAVRTALLEELRRIPGVRAVSFSGLGVFTGGNSASTIEVEGFVPRNAGDRNSSLDVVGPGYFSALGVPVPLGREILESDTADAPRVCVVNDAFARRFFEGRNPIGQRVSMQEERGGRTAYLIVGVARNAHTQTLRGDVDARFYVPAGQRPASTSPTFMIRTAIDPPGVMAAARATVERVAPGAPIVTAATMAEQMAPLTAQDRATARLVVVFGCVALALAAIGVYGVVAYGIARRTGEIAIRMALGAQAGRVVSLFVGETIGAVGVGLVFGGGLAWLAARMIAGRLYGVAPQDPLTLIGASALLLTVALGSAYWPAQRASRVDPMAVLRRERR